MIDRHILYVDNFRGFRDAYIPISDVNFLVGENSSGKTSILSLLNLMSAERLLLDSQFISDDVDLGIFEDIVSAHTTDPSYFRIGMIRREVTEKGERPLGMLVTYEKREGLPRDVCFTCTYQNKEIALRRIGKDIHFRTRILSIATESDVRALVAEWARDHKHPSGDFKKFEYPFGHEQSLLFPLSLVAQGIPWRKNRPYAPILRPNVFPPTIWLAAIRTKPKRTYDEVNRGFSAEGTHTPYLIRRILSSESEAKRFRASIRKVGKDSGLFEDVEIRRFGTDAATPFEVRILLDRKAKAFNLINVGYGVSQALPVIVEILWRPNDTWFAIQQPEVHLHPRAQAALGDLVFTSASSEKKRFLIETHSDFAIDRYRTKLRRSKKQKHTSQVLFFQRVRGYNTVTSLPIDKSGSFPDKQPNSYRKFFIKEQMDLLGI